MIVQDVSRYENNDMVVWAVRLLNRYFSSETDVFERAVDAQVCVMCCTLLVIVLDVNMCTYIFLYKLCVCDVYYGINSKKVSVLHPYP